MVTWFFENNQFADAWVPFDRSNQKKLEYVYRHHEELINWILNQQQHQQLEEENQLLQQQQEDATTNNNNKLLLPQQKENSENHVLPLREQDSNIYNPPPLLQNDINTKEEQEDALLKQTNATQQEPQQNIIFNDVDLEEEDASIHPYVQYDHNCIFIHLNDSHFEHEITLYPAMLLGSLPDRDILIVRAEMMDHNNNNKNKYLDAY